MISKKQALIVAAAVIGGAGLGLMVLGGGDKGDDNGEKPEELAKKRELMMHYEAPVHAPSDIYAPYSESNITDIIHNVVTNILPPVTPTPSPVITGDTPTGSYHLTGTSKKPIFTPRDTNNAADTPTGSYHLTGTSKKPIFTAKKKIITGARAATPGRMGMGKSYAAAHGGD
jgi:hypothetical protein